MNWYIKQLSYLVQGLKVRLCHIRAPTACRGNINPQLFRQPLACLFLFNKHNFYSIQRINCKYIDFSAKLRHYIGKRTEAQRKLLSFTIFISSAIRKMLKFNSKKAHIICDKFNRKTWFVQNKVLHLHRWIPLTSGRKVKLVGIDFL